MTPRKRGEVLTLQEVVNTALGIVDREGLSALTMRRLGAALGVEAMALYHHVPNKETLLDLIVERMRSEMRLPGLLPGGPAGNLEAVFVEYWRVLTAHPNMLPLATRRTNGSASGLQYLIDEGLPSEDAVELYQSMVAFTIGYSLLGSPVVEDAWAGLPDALAVRLREWREDTLRRTLRAVMDAYGLTRGGPSA